MAEDIIRHKGVVVDVTEHHVKVKIVQTSACAACSVKGHCNAAESKEKIVDVYDILANSYFVGDEVQLCGTTSMSFLAMLLAFGIPFAVVLSVLAIFLTATDGNELISAIASLLGLGPYYLILYLCRNKIKKEFNFIIEPVDDPVDTYNN